jgi:hypothetical protein
MMRSQEVQHVSQMFSNSVIGASESKTAESIPTKAIGHTAAASAFALMTTNTLPT